MLYGQTSLLLSDLARASLRDNDVHNEFYLMQERDENAVIDAFIKSQARVALVREDLLGKLYRESQKNPTLDYLILGKTTAKARLYFGSNSLKIIKSLDALVGSRVSIGTLGDGASLYMKQILQANNLLHRVNLVTVDAYRSIRKLQDNDIDALFLFAPESYENKIKSFISPYTQEMDSYFNSQSLLNCSARYCYLSYYLVASATLSQNTIGNIYQRSESILKKNAPLLTNVGNYFMYTDSHKSLYSQPTTKRTMTDKSLTKASYPYPSLQRAPWMDIALGEAMHAKGTPENVFPMLEQSYKYIRFSKGKAGITTAPNDSIFGSWCAAYVCWTLNKSGFKIHTNGRMASQSFRYNKDILYRKIDKPIFGAIVLYTKVNQSSHGHIGYLFGITRTGKYIILGGNQNNRLNFTAYPKRFGSYKLNGFYIPKGYNITDRDTLVESDIYESAKTLNEKYGIGSQARTIRVH